MFEKGKAHFLSSSDEEDEKTGIQYDKESDTLEGTDDTECMACGESYNSTRKKEHGTNVILRDIFSKLDDTILLENSYLNFIL